MKLFGRKTLALLLALTMMLSLCSFTAFAEGASPSGGTTESGEGSGSGEGTGTGTGTGEGTGGGTTPAERTLTKVELKSGETAPVVGFGTTEAEVKTKLAALKFTYTYSSGEPEEKTISSWSCTTTGGYKATVPGTYAFASDVGLETGNPSVNVTVKAVQSVELAAPSSVENDPALTSVSAVDKLPKNFTATFDGADAKTLKVTDYYTWSLTDPASYGSGVLVPKKYTYTATPKSEYSSSGLTAKTVVLTVTSKTVSNITAKLFYDEDGMLDDVSANVGKVNLRSLILAQLPAKDASNNALTYDMVAFTNYSMSVGSMDGETWRVNSWRYSDKDKETGSVQYSVTSGSGLVYTGTVNLTAVRFTGYIGAKVTNTSGTDSFFKDNVVNAIEGYLSDLGLSSSYYIVFDDIGSDGGTLYLTSAKNDVAEEDEVYSRSDLRDMYYESNYDGEKFELNYSVYDDKDANKYDRIFSGSIEIENPQILNLKVSITKDDVYNFSSQELQDALSELDSDWTLDRIELNSISVNGGKLCYDYDDSKSLSKNTSANRGTYYVEPSKSSQKSIDLITYVPKEKSSSRSYTAEFGFEAHYTYTDKRGKERTGTVDGMLVITVQEPADITISASANGYATLDASLFEDYCADHVRSTYKNYEICYVEFDGAPNSTAYGYLYENYKSGIYNGAKIKSPNGKKFALTDISAKDKNAYDLESVSYVPGTRNCTGGTFAIYGVKPGETIKSSTKFVKLCDGTIDFVIDGGSVSGNTKKVDLDASKTYSNFYYDLINSNVASVRFVSVTGGKLIYRDVSSQAPITPGTDVYYLSSTGYLAGRRMLSNVVFLPGYNQTSATITLKAFDAKGKSANAQYIFTIKPVTTSSFSDMNGYSSYAGSVGLMTNLGIINGVGNNKFNPTGTVTRGEWITMLYRAAGSPAVYSSVSFTDVPSWCKDAVQWAVQNGITDGIGNNKFGPDMTLDRMQIVTFMYRFAKLQGMDVSSTLYLSAYTDGNTVDTWAQPAMKWALQKGYLDPVGGKIQPKGTMTRVLVADCLARLLTK